MSNIAINSTAKCQQSDTAQCHVIWKLNKTHTKCTHFNVLLYLTSPLLTECQTQVSLRAVELHTGKAATTGSTLILALVYCCQIHALPALYPGLIEEKTIKVPVPIEKFWQEIASFTHLNLNKYPSVFQPITPSLSSMSYPGSRLPHIDGRYNARDIVPKCIKFSSIYYDISDSKLPYIETNTWLHSRNKLSPHGERTALCSQYVSSIFSAW